MRARSVSLALGLIGCTQREATAGPPHSPTITVRADRSYGVDGQTSEREQSASTSDAAPRATEPQRSLPPKPPTGMVFVPGGTFDMGMPQEITQGAPPERKQVGAFFLDRLEVTTEEYLKCVESGACSMPKRLPGCNATAKKPRLKHPINCVTQSQAGQYCIAAGKRLPSEPEWEFAARGTDGRTYPWGNEEPAEQLCWQGRRGAAAELTCPVGSLPEGASQFGALDMAGNVAEWTATEDLETAGRIASTAGPGAYYARGGGFPLTALDRASPEFYAVRSDNRTSLGADEGYRDVGMRCAKDLK